MLSRLLPLNATEVDGTFVLPTLKNSLMTRYETQTQKEEETADRQGRMQTFLWLSHVSMSTV